MNYKSLIALCLFLGLVSYGAAVRKVFTKTTHHDINAIPNYGYGDDDSDDIDGGPMRMLLAEDDSDDTDGGSMTRMLLAENELAGPDDVEGTKVYADGNCVLVRTCSPNADAQFKLTCTEEHVCEF